VVESLEVEHQRRLRAERVQALLQQIWGDELPPGPTSALTALIDAVGIDDIHGVQDQVVSQGDGLSYHVLAALWQHYRTQPPADLSSPQLGAGLHLPQVLAERLQALQLLPTPVPAHARPASSAPATPEPGEINPQEVDLGESDLGEIDPRTVPTPVVAEVGESTHVGVWEIDPHNDTVAFDAVTAQLIGAGEVAGHSTVSAHLAELVHPEDRAPVAEALQEAVNHETAYRVRFRVRSAAGVITHLISHGRVLRAQAQ
jgi:hypothetical protein